jgi:chromosome segregation ATPase
MKENKKMHRNLISSLTLLSLGWTALAQTPSTDSQTLQVLLTEVRQLRQELKTTTAAVERSQILIYRLQSQEAAVARAVQRLDDARSKLTQAQTNHNTLARRIKTLENNLPGVNNPVEKQKTEDDIAAFKAHIETVLLPEEQQNQSRVTDCEQQLRLEQEKLTEFQEQLDQLDTTLKKSDAK